MSVSGRGLPAVATCLSRCARPSLSPKGLVMASSCVTERQNWINLNSPIRRKGHIKSSGFKSRLEEPVLQMFQNTSPELQPIQTVCRSACGQQTPHYSHKKSPAPPQLMDTLWLTSSHGHVHTDENHAVIFPRAKAGDSLLQLLFVRGGRIRRERPSDIQAVKLLSSIQSRAEEQGCQPQQP